MPGYRVPYDPRPALRTLAPTGTINTPGMSSEAKRRLYLANGIPEF